VSKIIFLLGAGASRDAGLPLMADLTSGFPAWLAASSLTHKDRSKQLFDAAVKAVSPAGDNPNIEAVLTLLGQVSSLRLGPAGQIVTQWKAPFDGPDHEPAELAADIRAYIVERLGKVNPKDGEYLYGLLDFHDSDEPLDVFTMNYDRLVESMAARFGVRFTTGFGDVWDPGLFDVQNKWQMRVFKLHGSIAWYRLPGRPIIFQGSGEHYAFPGELSVDVLLYPAEGKESYAEPYATLMSSFTHALSEADFCVAIGYSFRDAHIRRTVLDRLATNPSLQLVIVNPSAQDVLSIPRERDDEPSFGDFADRIAASRFGAKQALEDRLIGHRLQEIRNADSVLNNVVQRRSGRDFNSAAYELIDAVERCRSTNLPNKPNRILRQVTGEFRTAMGTTLRATINGLGRAVGATPVTDQNPFVNAGERQPTGVRGGRFQENFGAFVSCWLLATVMSPTEDQEKIKGSLRRLLLNYVQGLLILEDKRYLTWPDMLDPGGDVPKELARRMEQLRSFADELNAWPPLTALGLVDDLAVQQYKALENGLPALADVLQAISYAPRRIRLEPDHSFIGIDPPTSWRVMLLNPLAASTLGQHYAKLQESGLVAAWLGDPVLSGAPAELADL
jgi:SIR2-like protein